MANVAPRTPMTAPFEVSEAPLRFMEDTFNLMYLSRTEQSVSRLTFLAQIHRRELRLPYPMTKSSSAVNVSAMRACSECATLSTICGSRPSRAITSTARAQQSRVGFTHVAVT